MYFLLNRAKLRLRSSDECSATRKRNDGVVLVDIGIVDTEGALCDKHRYPSVPLHARNSDGGISSRQTVPKLVVAPLPLLITFDRPAADRSVVSSYGWY